MNNIYTPYKSALILGQSVEVFKDSEFTQLIAHIYKVFGWAFDIKIDKDSNSVITVSKEQLVHVLSHSLHQSLPHVDNKTLLLSVKKHLNKSASYKNILQVEKLTNKIHKKFYKPVIKELFSKSINFENSNALSLEHKKAQIFIKDTLISKNRSFNLKETLLEYASLDSTHPDYLPQLLLLLNQNKMRLPKWIHLLVQDMSETLYKKLLEKTPKQAHILNSSSIRTPTEVLIDLLSYLRENRTAESQSLETSIKLLFRTHRATIDEVNSFLKNIQSSSDNQELIAKCSSLEKQLMKQPINTRLNDNIYGRAFDSAFVKELVDNPPKEVLVAMTQMANGLADHLENLVIGDKMARFISTRIKRLLTERDPRFWFQAIPELEQIKNKDSDQLQDLIAYLRLPKTTGHECISVSYLITKISLLLKTCKISPAWLKEADIVYHTYLHPQVQRIRLHRHSKIPLNTKGAGITLHYQPSIVEEIGMPPTQRPTTVRRPNFYAADAEEAIKSLTTALNHGIPWASGMSGSTNIALFAWKHFNAAHAINSKAALLGTMMFLVYDGGHSLHEPLWATNQVQKELDIGFAVTSADNTEGFVSDYEKFNDLYEGDFKEHIKTAFENSFTKVVDYFKKHSIYNCDASTN